MLQRFDVAQAGGFELLEQPEVENALRVGDVYALMVEWFHSQGQMEQAVRRADGHTRWGQHYLPSLLCAHRFQVCNNFKDASVQRYGGAVFDALRDVADCIFNDLPAPTPSRTGTCSFASAIVWARLSRRRRAKARKLRL